MLVATRGMGVNTRSCQMMHPSGDATLYAHFSTAFMTECMMTNWKSLGQLGSTVPTFGGTEVDTKKKKAVRMARSSAEIRIGAEGFR